MGNVNTFSPGKQQFENQKDLGKTLFVNFLDTFGAFL
jgi:hypothetical protein